MLPVAVARTFSDDIVMSFVDDVMLSRNGANTHTDY